MEQNFIHGLSGALSSMISTAILHPFETIRVKMQAELNEVYLYGFIKKIIREEGIKSVYAGFTSSVLSIALSYAMYFFSFNHIKNIIKRRKQGFGVVDDAISSFIASIIVIVFNTPWWTINTRLVKDKSKNFREVFYQILYKEGPAAFFKGMSLSILLTVNPVIQYSLYESLKRRYKASHALQYFILAGISKLVATIFTYPLLTIRTRSQLNEKDNKSFIFEILAILQTLLKFKTHEFLALYNGFFSKSIQTVLNSAIILSLNEKFIKILTIPKAALRINTSK